MLLLTGFVLLAAALTGLGAEEVFVRFFLFVVTLLLLLLLLVGAVTGAVRLFVAFNLPGVLTGGRGTVAEPRSGFFSPAAFTGLAWAGPFLTLPAASTPRASSFFTGTISL